MNLNKLAKYIEIAFFPLIPIILGLLFITFYIGTMIFENITVLMICAVVFAISHLIVRSRIKEQNKKYFISSALISVVFYVLARIVGVSQEILFAGVTLFVVAVFTYAIRPHWKISAHMIGFVSMVTVLSFVNIYFSVMYVLAPLVAWSRLRLKRHTLQQVIAGTIMGFVVPIVISLFLAI